MPDNKDFVLNSVNQFRHFDFDSTLLANKVFNAFILKWNQAVVKTLIPEIDELIDNKLPKEDLEKFKELCLNRLFQRGKINLILDKFKKTIDSKVLSIPKDFILNDDAENAKLNENEADCEQRLLEEITAKRAKILQLRIQVETLKKLHEIQMGN